MTKSTTTVTPAGCLGVVILLLMFCGTAFLFWKFGYVAGGSDEYAKWFSEQKISSITASKTDFLNKINDYRVANHRQILRLNPALEKTAEARANTIYASNVWSHNGYQSAISAEYHNWWTIGENLARFFYDFDSAFRSWQISPSHNENLLNPEYCEAGLGVYSYVWVLHLGCRS